MKRVLALALLITIALALTACSDSSETSRVSAAPPVAHPAATSPIAAEDSGFAASGPIVVENQVDVAALREGVVVSILAEPNTPVRKGQLLARLDDRQISADLDAASAKTRSIEANLKNWEAETKVLESDLSARPKALGSGRLHQGNAGTRAIQSGSRQVRNQPRDRTAEQRKIHRDDRWNWKRKRPGSSLPLTGSLRVAMSARDRKSGSATGSSGSPRCRLWKSSSLFRNDSWAE